MTASGRPVLVGRADEYAALLQVLGAVRAGLSGVLVLRGEAGIGKSALLDEAAASADDLVVIRIVGIESEMTLGFAALHQALSRFMSGIDELPAPQARALHAVFGTVDDTAPDRFLLGLAALTLLSNSAVDRGIVIVVDDAQWLDEESAHVLGFIARRLYADRIGLLIAQRDKTKLQVALEGLPTLTVRELRSDRADELLRLNVDGEIAESVRRRIIEDAGGSPLALLEMTRELSPDQRAGIEPLPRPYPITQDLEARFLRRIRVLPADTQKFLLVAATDPTGDPGLVRDAVRMLGCDPDASGPAEAEGLLRGGSRVEFSHPLIRSAVYQGVAPAERRGAHAALAAVTDREREPDQRAWHRAAATIEPDEEVANELELAASRAQTFGSYVAYASLLARAAELTPDPAQRAARYLGATVAALTAGKASLARGYLIVALPDLVEPLLVAQARRLEATVDFINVTPDESDVTRNDRRRDVASAMVDAATSLQALDVRLAREVLLEALPMAVYIGAFSTVSPREVARCAQTMRLPDDLDATPVDELLDSLADLYADWDSSAVPSLRAAVARMTQDPDDCQHPRHLLFGCWAAFALSDDASARVLAQKGVERGREVDAWQVVVEGLMYLGVCELRSGSVDAVDRIFTEVHDLASLLGNESAYPHSLIVAAWRGEAAEVRRDAEVISRAARERVVGYLADVCEHAVALLELGLGNYGLAPVPALATLDHDLAFASMRAADAVEGCARGGHPLVAAQFVEWLTLRAAATQSSFDVGLLERSRAITSDDAHAEGHFVDSIAQFGKTTSALQLARTQLLYGEWLRRQNRRRDAREQLAAAHETFETEGAAGFEQRARTELLATGARARKRSDDTRQDLTPQEQRIARLAAQGATNPEIGARLFISPSTVDYHLRKVYAKLAIGSRRELVHTVYFEPEPSA